MGDRIEDQTPEKATPHRNAQLVGLHRNPSGQTSLAFDTRVKSRVAREQQYQPSGPSKTQIPISKFFTGKHQSSLKDKKMSISMTSNGDKTKVKIVFNGGKQPIKSNGTSEIETIELSDEEEEDEDGCPVASRPNEINNEMIKQEQVATNSSLEVIDIASDDDTEPEPVACCSKSIPVDEPASKRMRLERVDPPVIQALDSFNMECKNALPETEFPAVQKKISKRRQTLEKSQLSNSKLEKLIVDETLKIASNPTKVYVFIKNVLDELKRSSGTSTASTEDPVPSKSESKVEETGSDPVVNGKPETGVKSATKRHIAKLRKALDECAKAIKKLEEKECNLNDDDNSAYLKESRYKRKFMQIYRKLAEYERLDASLGRRQDKKFRFDGSRIPEINIKIEKYINGLKQQHKECVPDFRDVLVLCTQTNQDKGLNMTKEDIQHEAKETFQAIIRKLKSRRLHDDWEILEARIPLDQVDPAEEDSQLKEKLTENLKLGQAKMNEIWDQIERKQEEKGEAPEEVPDGEDEDLASNEQDGDDSSDDNDADHVHSGDVNDLVDAHDKADNDEQISEKSEED